MVRWLSKFTRPALASPRRAPRRARSYQVRLEQLEVRTVLSTITSVNGMAVATTSLTCTGVGVATIDLQGPVEPASDFSATIDWGDQSNPVQADAIKYTSADMEQLIVRGSHIYAQTGAYSITVTVYHATETPVAATAVGHIGAGQVMYVTNNTGNSILAIDSAGNASTFAYTTPSNAPSGPSGIAVDADGNIYVANDNTNSVQEFSPGGQDLGVFCTGLNLPTALTFDAAGNLYVANARNGVVEKFSSSGQDLGEFVVDQIGVYGILFDSQGNFFLSNGYESSTSWIKEYSPSGQFLRTFANASDGLDEPVDMCFDGQGNLYVLNSLGADIEKFAPDGQVLGVFAQLNVSEPFNGLRFDSQGNLYACEYFQGRIVEFDSTGHSLGVFASGLNTPDYIAFAAPVPNLAPNTSTAVASSSTANTSSYGDLVTFTATVANTSGSVAPSGNVEFYDGATDLGPGTFGSSDGNSATWTLATATLSAGSHDIQARFTSSFDFNDSNGDVTQTVNARGPDVDFTSTSVASSSTGNTSIYGDSVTFTATVSNTSGSTAPSGQVEFFDGATDLGPGTPGSSNGNSTTWKLATTALSAGSHDIQAYFSNSLDFNDSNGVVTQTVDPRVLDVNFTGLDKVYDGATTATAAYTDDAFPQDSVALSYTASFADKNVGAAKPMSVSDMVIIGSSAADYVLTSTTAATTASITPRSLLITATGVNKVYDGTTNASVTLADNRISGDVFDDSYASANFADSNVGMNKVITVTGISVSGPDAGNYTGNSTAAAFGNIGTGQTLYVSSYTGSRIYVIDGSGNESAIVNQLPSGMAIDTQGNLYVADYNGDRIDEISPAGDQRVFASTGLDAPIDLTFDSQGNLYASNFFGNTVEKFSPTGQDLGVFAHDPNDNLGFVTPAFDSHGDLFVSHESAFNPSSSWIDEFSPTGQYLGKFATAADGLNVPTGICFDSRGNLYALNYGSGNIEEFDPSGQTHHVFATTSDPNPEAGLAIDSLGNVYACEDNQGRVEEFDSSGHSLGFIVPGGGNDAYFCKFAPSSDTNLAPNTSTVVASSSTANTSTYGDSVTFTATVTNTTGSAAPVGNVEFFDGATDLGAGTLGSSNGNSTSWTFTSTASSAGSHDIQAFFTGSLDFDNSSGDVTQSVNPRALDLSFSASDKVYDGTTSASVSYTADALPGDTVSVTYVASFADKNVGMGKTVNIGNIVIIGRSAADYVLTSATATATASVTPRSLTVTAVGIDKVYDGATSATVTLSDNRISGDLFTDSYTAANFADSNVGANIAISVDGISISGADAGNYTWNSTATASANITPEAAAGTAYLLNGVLFIVATPDADAFTLSATLPTGAASYSMKVTRVTNGKTVQLGTFAVPTQAIAVVSGNASDMLKLVGTGSGDSFAYDFANTSTFLTFEAAPSSAQATGFNLDLGGLSAVTLQGGAGSDTLTAASTGPGGINTWDITGSNAGTLEGIAFTGIENLVGNAADDHFVFVGTGSVSGVIDGGTGNNVLDFSARTSNLTVTLKSIGYNSASGTGGWGNIGIIYGTAAATNTLVGASAPSTWHIDGINSGDVNGQVAFIGFANLTGGSGDDKFQFSSGGSITGNLTGGSGSDTLDLSASLGSVTVNLAAKTATGIGGAWTSISTFIGAGVNDTLVGANTTNTWQITGAGSGVVTGSIAFQGFTNLTGGSGKDTFQIGASGAVTGLIDGQGGVNTLDYSSYANNVYANLQTGLATATGGIEAIQNLTGGLGNDILVGDANNNVLIDKTGRNLLIGGGGGDALTSGSGGSILIAGITAYDRNTAALAALEAVWAGDTNYNLAVAALLAGVDYIGADGQHHVAALNSDTVSQQAGSSPSTLTGGSGLDWFFAALTDTVKNRKTGEIVMTL